MNTDKTTDYYTAKPDVDANNANTNRKSEIRSKILYAIFLILFSIIVVVSNIISDYISNNNVNNNINKYNTAQTASYADKINAKVKLYAVYAGDYLDTIDAYDRK